VRCKSLIVKKRVGASGFDFANEILASLQKVIECHRLIDHSLETALVFG
jgi:hypothetical protein